jgi:hypothetical protein
VFLARRPILMRTTCHGVRSVAGTFRCEGVMNRMIIPQRLPLTIGLLWFVFWSGCSPVYGFFPMYDEETRRTDWIITFSYIILCLGIAYAVFIGVCVVGVIIRLKETRR